MFIQGKGNQPGRKGNKGSPGQPVSLTAILNANVVLDVPLYLLNKVKSAVKWIPDMKS